MEKSELSYRDAESLTKWVKYFLYLQVVISIVALISGYLERQLLNDFASGIYLSQSQAQAAGEASDSRQTIVGGIQFIIFLISGFLILRWIHRANFNARQLGAENMKFTPGWSIGWYFVPIAALWKPYQAMKEIWKTSHAPNDWEELKAPSLLSWWWFLFIASSMLGNISLRITLLAEDLDAFLNANAVTLASDLASIPLALVTLLLVKNIYGAQLALRSTG